MILFSKPLRASINSASIAHWLSKALLLFCTSFLLIPCILSVFNTTFFVEHRYEHFEFSSLISEDWLFVATGIAVAIAIAILILLIVGILQKSKVPDWLIVLVSITITTAFGIWWVASQHAVSNDFPDSYRLLKFAKEAAGGDWSSFTDSAGVSDLSQIPDDAHLYFLWYPFQSGIFWLFYLYYFLFGESTVLALQITNVIANEITLLALYGIYRRLLGKESIACIALLSLGELALLMSSSLPYGNNIGLSFGTLFLLMQAEALESKTTKRCFAFIALSIPLLCVTLIIKSTFILFAIASIIVWAIVGIKEHNALPIVAMTLVLAISSSLSSAPIRALERKAGYSFGDGMPKLSWIAMGLNDSELLGMAGMWDYEASSIFTSSNADMEEQSEKALSSIVTSVENFASDIPSCISFFIEKLSIEWADPLYQSMMYSELSVDAENNYFDPFEALGITFPGRRYIALLDGFQILIYCTSLFSVVKAFRSRAASPTLLLLAATFFAGFGCYLLWECKSIYTLPFFVLLLPLSAQGMTLLSSMFGDMVIKMRSKGAERSTQAM